MNELSLQQFNDLLSSEQISPYSIYGLDIDYQQYFSINHYINNQDDTLEKDQKLNILFLDLEVYTGNAGEFPKPNQSKYPISAITIYDTQTKIFRSYFLLQRINIDKFPNKDQFDKLIEYYKNELINNEYIGKNEEFDLDIQIFTYELDLVKTCWNQVKKIDPTILSGWNSDRFDFPYIYFRLSNLLNKNEKEVQEILSRFGVVKIHKLGEEIFVQIPEAPICDLLQLYKPRDEGGLAN
jgi:DNA polymerase elongation subunit (family B)